MAMGGEDQAGHGPVGAGMGDEAETPCGGHDREAPGAKPGDDDERRSDRRAEAAEEVPGRFIGGGKPGWVFRCVGSEHERDHEARADKRDPHEFARAPFQRCLGFAVE